MLKVTISNIERIPLIPFNLRVAVQGHSTSAIHHKLIVMQVPLVAE